MYLHKLLALCHDLVKGFAVGRAIFADVAQRWFAGALDDAAAVDAMAANYRAFCDLWDAARARTGEPA